LQKHGALLTPRASVNNNDMSCSHLCLRAGDVVIRHKRIRAIDDTNPHLYDPECAAFALIIGVSFFDLVIEGIRVTLHQASHKGFFSEKITCISKPILGMHLTLYRSTSIIDRRDDSEPLCPIIWAMSCDSSTSAIARR
jgi:hypothetical protein